jgi:hypothetical protein
MRHCLFCDHALGAGIPDAPAPGRRHAYDPGKGRLWEICPRCRRWNPVPLELRWETLEGWERAVRDRGSLLLEAGELALLEVDDGQVVRVGEPPLATWGGWRYGSRLPAPPAPRVGFLRRLLGGLPPPPLEGYDPYGLSGPMGGVAGTRGPAHWLGSPFLDRAHPLTLVFASIPFAPACPACGGPMPLNPWDFHRMSFTDAALDGGSPGRPVGASDGKSPAPESWPPAATAARRWWSRWTRRARRSGWGSPSWTRGPRRGRWGPRPARRWTGSVEAASCSRGWPGIGAPLGELGRVERVALGIALDARAEADALVTEWREAEEITAIMDADLTDVAGFLAFRERVLGG